MSCDGLSAQNNWINRTTLHLSIIQSSNHRLNEDVMQAFFLTLPSSFSRFAIFRIPPSSLHRTAAAASAPTSGDQRCDKLRIRLCSSVPLISLVLPAAAAAARIQPTGRWLGLSGWQPGLWFHPSVLLSSIHPSMPSVSPAAEDVRGALYYLRDDGISSR